MNSGRAAKSKANPEPDAPKLGLRERKQRFTKNAIWDAAIDLFAEKGYDDTTIDEISEAAFVSRRSFFRYFESKHDLMARPIADLANSLSQAVASSPKNASAAELLRYVVSVLVQEAAAEPRTAKVMQIAARFPAAREALLSRMTTVQGEIEDAFRRRFKDPFTVQVLSSLTLSALSLATHHWFAGGQKDVEVSTRKVFSAIAEFVKEPSSNKG
jgi:AcrR family transcriptional regulator